MRILITNDDGINASGLRVLHSIATDLAGPNGEVWTVAPAFEQSGVAHCISYTKPLAMAKLGERNFTTEGSPADCVIAALYDVMPNKWPDIVLSGVNRGNNAAENTLYSGTLGGAMEAALQGIPSIGLSQYFGPQNADLPNPFEASAEHGAKTIRAILKASPVENRDYRLFYNVNFPPVAAADVKGIRTTTQGYRRGTNFSAEPHSSPSGRRFLWLKGGDQHVETGEGTDASANLAGYTSITPMRADLTAHSVLGELKGALDT